MTVGLTYYHPCQLHSMNRGNGTIIVISVITLVLGLSSVAPALAADSYRGIYLDGCGEVTGSLVSCTFVWDTNQNDVCEAEDMHFTMMVVESYTAVIQEQIPAC